MQRGLRRVGLTSLFSGPSRPQCLLPPAGCCRAALSRPPSCSLHFSVCPETVTIIHLAGAVRPRTWLSSPRLRVSAGAPEPSLASDPALTPSRLLPVPLGAHPAPRQSQGQSLFCWRHLPLQGSGWSPAHRGISQGSAWQNPCCCVLSAPNQCLLLVSLQSR